MPKRPSPHPTEAELEVLAILWRKGPSTVREVHDIVEALHQTSLTTTLKTMQVMTEKGLILCSDERPHRYTAAAPEERTQAGMLKDLLQRAFDGSARKLLVRLVEDGGVSQNELDDLARLIQGIRKDKRGAR
jgi:BlaI family transcriptional regulator, penicillinase repressor